MVMHGHPCMRRGGDTKRGSKNQTKKKKRKKGRQTPLHAKNKPLKAHPTTPPLTVPKRGESQDLPWKAPLFLKTGASVHQTERKSPHNSLFAYQTCPKGDPKSIGTVKV